jgi:prefoldin subunit 5
MEKYTTEEISKNIDFLQKRVEKLQLEKTELTKNINSAKKTNSGLDRIRQNTIKTFLR